MSILHPFRIGVSQMPLYRNFRQVLRRLHGICIWAVILILWSIDLTAAFLDRYFHMNLRRLKVTAEEIDTLIAEALPGGSSYAQVVAFLETHHIAHSHRLYAPLQPSQYFPPDERLARDRDRIQTMMFGWIESAGRGLFVQWTISTRFYFDAENKLIGSSTQVQDEGL